MRHIIGNEVCEVAVFCMVPDLLGGIQLRRIGGKPLEREPFGMRGLEMLGRRAMNVEPVPHQDNLSAEVMAHLGEKPDHVLSLDIMLQQLKKQAGIAADRRQSKHCDGRQPVVPIPRLLKRRLAARRPSPAPHRLQHEAAFIEENYAGLLFSSLFLMRGHSLRRQRSISTSLRSLARCSGF